MIWRKEETTHSKAQNMKTEITTKKREPKMGRARKAHNEITHQLDQNPLTPPYPMRRCPIPRMGVSSSTFC
jgi:hypothetical protein